MVIGLIEKNSNLCPSFGPACCLSIIMPWKQLSDLMLFRHQRGVPPLGKGYTKCTFFFRWWADLGTRLMRSHSETIDELAHQEDRDSSASRLPKGRRSSRKHFFLFLYFYLLIFHALRQERISSMQTNSYIVNLIFAAKLGKSTISTIDFCLQIVRIFSM